MQILSASSCGLSKSAVSPAILDVIESLTKAGFQAYVVGGSVRDLLLGHQPKDFDAVTNATPSQIKKVFGRRCRIIGRRFELAHVHSGRELIEVATFRAPPKKAITNATGMVLRDNNWGSIDQDYVRRDFTVNSLYYQPFRDEILDFAGGYQDIQNKTLRLLGQAQQRFEEDPVRMLRTLRFSAKLGFQIDQSIIDVFTPDNIKLLREVSPHRLYDETQKMFSLPCLERLVELLKHYGVWDALFIDQPAEISPLLRQAASNTDQRLASGKTVNPAFFYAILLWQPYLQRIEFYHQKGLKGSEARIQAGMDVLKKQASRTIMPRFAELFIREVWEMQNRLVHAKPQHIMTLLNHPRFRAGFDFLMLREQVGDETTLGMANWWEHFQYLNNDQKEKAISDYRRQHKRVQRVEAEKATELLDPSKNDPTELSKKSKNGKKLSLTQPAQFASVTSDDDFELLAETPTIPKKAKKADPNTVPTPASHKAEAVLDHPILRRRRVERDVSQLIFGPTR